MHTHTLSTLSTSTKYTQSLRAHIRWLKEFDHASHKDVLHNNNNNEMSKKLIRNKRHVPLPARCQTAQSACARPTPTRPLYVAAVVDDSPPTHSLQSQISHTATNQNRVRYANNEAQHRSVLPE